MFLPINEHLQLKLFTPQDSASLFQLVDQNRLYLREWLPWVDGTKTPDESLDFIRLTLKQFGEQSSYTFGIWYQEKLSGVIGTHQISWHNRATSVGYWIAKEAQGQGIAIQSCKAFVRFLFKELKLNRIEICAATENKKSQAIPNKLGFQFEGVKRESEWLYDHFVDHACFSILAKDHLK